MAVLSAIDIDLGKAAPLLVLGVIGLGGIYLWQRQQKQNTANAAAQAASPVAQYQAAEDIALLQSLSGGTTASMGNNGNAPVVDPALPTYSAPGSAPQTTTTVGAGSSAPTLGNLDVTIGTGNGI